MADIRGRYDHNHCDTFIRYSKITSVIRIKNTNRNTNPSHPGCFYALHSNHLVSQKLHLFKTGHIIV